MTYIIIRIIVVDLDYHFLPYNGRYLTYIIFYFIINSIVSTYFIRYITYPFLNNFIILNVWKIYN